MWKSIRATTRQGIREVDDLLHNALFDLESARVHEESRTGSLAFEIACWDEAKTVFDIFPLLSRRRIPVRAGTLTMRGVVRFSAEDRAKIQLQTVRHVTLDQDGKRLRIEMNQDGDVFAEFASLDVAVDVADPVVRRTSATWFLFGEWSEF